MRRFRRFLCRLRGHVAGVAYDEGAPFGICIRCGTELPDYPACESCGTVADLRLDDGSTWCITCDAGARIAGYDNRPATPIEVVA